jgi:hypothetical protein
MSEHDLVLYVKDLEARNEELQVAANQALRALKEGSSPLKAQAILEDVL